MGEVSSKVIDALSGFLESAVDFFSVIFKLIWLLLSNIWFTVQSCLSLFSNLPTMFAWLPGEAFALMLSLVTIAIVFGIAGKE